MVNELEELEISSAGKAIVYANQLESIRQIYKKDPQKAGEMAIAVLEIAMTGDTSFREDMLISLALKDYATRRERDQDRYAQKVESDRARRIEGLRLREIASLMRQGVAQIEIAKRLGLAKSTVSERVRLIKGEFKEELEEEIGEDWADQKESPKEFRF